MPRTNQNLNRVEAAALRAIALEHGFVSARGPLVKDGQESGNGLMYVLAIISGQVATILLDDEDRQHAIAVLLASNDEVLQDIGKQLARAALREQRTE